MFLLNEYFFGDFSRFIIENVDIARDGKGIILL